MCPLQPLTWFKQQKLISSPWAFIKKPKRVLKACHHQKRPHTLLGGGGGGGENPVQSSPVFPLSVWPLHVLNFGCRHVSVRVGEQRHTVPKITRHPHLVLIIADKGTFRRHSGDPSSTGPLQSAWEWYLSVKYVWHQKALKVITN